MGCVRCGRRQVDPVSGPSAWRRAVIAGEQVLVCPECQTDGWTDDLDRCPHCGSTQLVKQLGDVRCRACLAVLEPERGRSAEDLPATDRSALADEVAAALDRVLRGD